MNTSFKKVLGENEKCFFHFLLKNRRNFLANPIYMYNIFFTHSSVDGHLVCLHILAIVNSAAVITGVVHVAI